MKVYIVERDSASFWKHPDVFTDGKLAVETVREEFLRIAKEEFDIDESEIDAEGLYECEWYFYEDTFTGTARLGSMYDESYYKWRITEHEL